MTHNQPTFNLSLNASTSSNQLQSSQQEDVANLISSIENKLSMLACEDSHLELSYRQTKQSPQRQLLTATDDGKGRLNIRDLEVSGNWQDSRVRSGSNDTRVLEKINKMEVYYMEKLQQLNSKLSVMELENQDLRRKNDHLDEKNKNLQGLLTVKEQNQLETINSKVEEIKKDLIIRFADEAELHYKEHLNEMKKMSGQLAQYRNRNMYLEEEVRLLRSQKTNIEVFYKNLLNDHKTMIKMDMQKGKREIEEIGDDIRIERVEKVERKHKSGTKPKQKKKKGEKSTKSELTNEEMIPFLAKGIKQLKEKLNIQ